MSAGVVSQRSVGFRCNEDAFNYSVGVVSEDHPDISCFIKYVFKLVNMSVVMNKVEMSD